ncbi:disulfide bond formation protein B [Ruegeria sp. SCSIO 43209]|uniref:disulfide bond formation protein B n=1 Tax=Ruegeria sp. SCSIO 43209 TaxID=2793010 RepID=UPI00147F5FD7|nr:disulfide bond formation protein B [Ruegeria sp. SCSIO 43209]UAB88120.1 disulfide bond formation protein B [Ruegeria sp. SCSIO 43209]
MTRFSKDTLLGLAWAIALVASLSVLFIGEILGQTPCVLCWFQRAFMFPLAIVLGLGLWWQDQNVGRYGIALAFGGAAVALWHMGLYAGLIPEKIQPCSASGPSCTDANQSVLGIPIPLMALVSFALIGALCALSLKEKQV